MKKRNFLAASLAAAMSLVPLTAAQAAELAPAASDKNSADQLLAYAEAHPADVDGFKALAVALGGDAKSTSSTLRTDEVPGLTGGGSNENAFAAANFPQDVFTVNVVTGTVGDIVVVTGSVDWRDDFAGQAAPFDIAALRFSSNCGTLSNLSASTRSVSGVDTARASLRDAGIGTNAPIWNVDATTSGFENQADRGSFQAQYDKTACAGAPVQAAFDYEGNQGGSIVSVSASFAGLSVGYSAPGLTLKKSTQPLTL